MGGSGNQFWSISVEEQFYLLAPLIIILAPMGKSLKLWLAIALTLVLLDSNFGTIALGVCAAILQRDYNFADKLCVRLGAMTTAVICAIALSMQSSTFIFKPMLAAAVVIALAIPGRRSPIALIAGGLSYPLYLNHWIGVFAVNFLSKRWFPINETTFIVSQYVLNVLIALAMYWVIDRVIHKRRNAWFSPGMGRSIAYIAYGLVSIGILAGGSMHLFGPHAEVPKTSYQAFERKFFHMRFLHSLVGCAIMQ